MATRLYLRSGLTETAVPVSTWSAGWNKTTGAASHVLLLAKNARNANNYIQLPASGTSGHFTAFGRFISEPLAAQTVSGSLTGTLVCRQILATDNFTLAVAAKVIKADGTDRGVLIGVSASTGTATPPEWGTAAEQGRSLRDVAGNASLALSSVAAQLGDRIVVEVGLRQASTVTTNGTIHNHAGAATDASGDTGGIATAGWIEFSQTLDFPIQYFSTEAIPVDSPTATNVTDPTVITPPTGMQAGDLCLMIGQQRATGAALAVSATGGQSWTSETAIGTTNQTARLFWCVFDGTWTANPSVDFSATTCNSVQMHVFRPSGGRQWSIEVAQTETDFAGSPADIPGHSPGVSPSISIAGWFTADDNTWGTVVGNDWVSCGYSNAEGQQFRNTSGSDQSATYAYRIFSDVLAAPYAPARKTQLTLGADPGTAFMITFKATLAVPPEGSLATTEVADDATMAGTVIDPLVTYNPADKHPILTLSNGNLTVSTNDPNWLAVRNTRLYSTGKRYFEWRADAFGGDVDWSIGAGLATSAANLGAWVGWDTNSYGFLSHGYAYYNSVATGVGHPLSLGEWGAVAVDFDGGKIWFRDADGWIGDPAAGTGNTYSFTPGTALYGAASLANAGSQSTANFGSTALAYHIPSGFSRWSPIVDNTIYGTVAATDTANTAAVAGFLTDTFNPADKGPNIALSNGNLTATSTAASEPAPPYQTARGRLSHNSGKYYFEMSVHQEGDAAVGILSGDAAPLSDYWLGTGDTAGWSAGYWWAGAVFVTGNPDPIFEGMSQLYQGEFVRFAVDFDTGKAWVGNSWGWVGDPVAGTGNTISFTPGLALYAGATSWLEGDTSNARFGTTAYAYHMPAGFQRWSPVVNDTISGPLAVTGALDTGNMTGTVAWVPVTGTITAPETADDATMAGTVAWPVLSGPFAVTEGADDATMTGAVTWLATLAVQETPEDATMTGAVAWPVLSGPFAVTETADDATMMGTVAWPVISGPFAVIEAADDATMDGAVAWPVLSGPFAVIETADDATMAGTVTWPILSGPFAVSETPDDATMDGTIAFPVLSGPFAVIETPDDATMTGALTWLATLTAPETPDDATLAGTVAWLATLAAPEGADDATMAGSVTWLTTLAAPETPDDATMAGSVTWLTALAAIETPDDATLAGAVTWPAITGTLGVTEAADTALIDAGAGFGEITGTFAIAEGADDATITGGLTWLAQLDADETADGATLAGSVRWLATLTVQEMPDDATIAGTVAWTAALAVSETSDTFAASGLVFSVITGTVTAPETADDATMAGVVLSGVGGVMAAPESADTPAMTGQVTGFAGTLGAIETPDTAAITVSATWLATLAATEGPNSASFTGAVHWTGVLATSETPDSANFAAPIPIVGTMAAIEPPDDATIAAAVRWLAVLVGNEYPDTAAGSGLVAWRATMAAAEAGDAASALGSVQWLVRLTASEAPDDAAFGVETSSEAVLTASELPDRAAFTAAPPSIQEAKGHILRSTLPRVRLLESGEHRVRTLRYPVPRPRVMLNTYGQRVRALDGQRTRALEKV